MVLQPTEPLTRASTTFEGHFKQGNHQQKAPKFSTKYVSKIDFFTIQEMKQEGRIPPYLTSAGNMCQTIQIFCHSGHVCESTKALILGLEIYFSK